MSDDQVKGFRFVLSIDMTIDGDAMGNVLAPYSLLGHALKGHKKVLEIHGMHIGDTFPPGGKVVDLDAQVPTRFRQWFDEESKS